MNRRNFLSAGALLLFTSPLRTKEPLSLEAALRTSFGRSSRPELYIELSTTEEPKQRMYWTVGRSLLGRTAECFREWADLVLRQGIRKGFVLRVGEDRYQVDPHTLNCTPLN